VGRRRSIKDAEPEEGVIRDVTTEGKGVVATADKTVFVDGALTGETIRFQRRKKRRNYDEADLLEVISASPDRVEPPCEFFLNCGGCTWQHLAPEQQVLMKQNALLQAFERIGSVQPGAVMPPLTGVPGGYRRRARFGVKFVDGKGRVLVGFRERVKPFIADMSSCVTVYPRLSELLPKLQELIIGMSINRRLPQVEASVGEDAISLVFRVLDEPSENDKQLLAKFEQDEDVRVLLQRKGPDTITVLASEAEPEKLHYSIPAHDVRIAFGPVDFIQVNHEINLAMIDQALNWLQLSGSEKVLDLFSGLGNFSLPLARHAAFVTGVEGEQRSVQGARDNAAANGIDNTAFHVANLFEAEVLEQDKPGWLSEHYDVVVLDPPRAGAAEILPFIKKMQPAKILYVSCHPGTLARDSETLANELGYTLVQAGVIDMFPQTGHVESMALFTAP